MKATQSDIVLHHLQHQGALTSREALRLYGVARLGARIYDLRRRGHRITAVTKRVRTRWGHARVAEYRLARDE